MQAFTVCFGKYKFQVHPKQEHVYPTDDLHHYTGQHCCLKELKLPGLKGHSEGSIKLNKRLETLSHRNNREEKVNRNFCLSSSSIIRN